MNYCVIFDLDGTLIDSRADLAAAVNRMRADFALPPLPEERVCGYVGNGVRELVRRSLEGAEVDPEEAFRKMSAHYLEHPVDHTVLYPGVRTGLAELCAAGFAVGVVTNKFEKAAKLILQKLDILKYIDKLVGGDGPCELKPSPEGLLYVMRELNAAPATTWMFGDHYTDLRAARLAGVRGAYASYGIGDPRGEEFEFEADSFATFVQEMLLERFSG